MVVLVKESSPAPTVPEKPVRPSKKKARTIKDQPREPTAPPSFMSIHTLSLRDRRYRQLGLAVDGIGVKLKKTENDGAVDLDLYDGNKRIQKVRDLELGRSQTFRGKSGTLYRLTLLGVHHRTHTIRLGVRRT